LPLLFVVTGMIGLNNSAWAGNDNAQQQQVEALTHKLVGLNARYQNSGSSDDALFDELVETAEVRQQLLQDLLNTNPEGALKVTLPSHISANMPAGLSDRLETIVTVDGEYEALYEDYADGHANLRHFLKANGKRTELFFAGQPPNRLTGDKVRVHGLKIKDAIALDSDDEILTLAAGDGSSNGGTAAPTENTLGEQRTLVLLVNFQDQPNNKPWTIAETQDMVFGQTSDFFYENSYQQTWLSGDVHGWFTIAMSSTDMCSQPDIASQADAAATAAGVDLTSYSRFLYIFPQNTCSWSGLSTVGGNPSRSFINGAFELMIVGHELGHAFGLYHSHGMNCTNTVVGSNCPWIEYGDMLDIMGNRVAHINALQKEWLGWLGHGSSPSITTIETNGTYTLPPFETTESAAKALKVLRNIDPVTGKQNWYYLEYRQAIGFDSFLTEYQPYLVTSNVLNGIVLHLGTEDDRSSSFLLDMTPDSDNRTSSSDLFDPALETGNTYSDSESGITISTQWTDTQGATVSVTLGQQSSCVTANPTLVMTPSQSQWVEPGTPVTFSVTVTNNDSTACANAYFDLMASVPVGWSGALANQELDLTPGTSGSTTLQVVSASSAADGFYDIPVTATNSTDSSFNNSNTATYVVSASTSSNSAPVAVNDSATMPQKTTITINVLSNDWDPENDFLNVVTVGQGSKGSVINNGDGTVTYTPAKRFKNNDNFSYTISDGQATATATVSIALLSSDGSGDGDSKGGGKGNGKPSN